MTQIIKVSKSGKNVLTETDPNSFIFDSTVNTFKIISTGTVTDTITTDGQNITVAHGQGTTPVVFAFCKFPDGKITLPGGFERSNPPSDRYWFVNVDSTNMNFKFNKGTSANYSPIVRYYVFETTVG